MTALSDPSGDLSSLWPWWVWAVVLATAALITLTAHAIAHAPEQEPELSWLDHADGVTCHRGHYYQLNPARDTWVCATCHHHVPREIAS